MAKFIFKLTSQWSCILQTVNRLTNVSWK